MSTQAAGLTLTQRDERVIRGWFNGETVTAIKAATGIRDWTADTIHLGLPPRDHNRQILPSPQGAQT